MAEGARSTGLCRECRWWGDKDDGQFGGQRPCELTVTVGDSTDAQHADSLALARGDFWYAARLTTAPTFGCVQFEAKES